MADDPEKLARWERQLVILKRSATWQPATDAYETADRFMVTVELAGMREGDFTVHLMDRRLVISGKRTRPMEQEPTAYHQLEIQYGDFRTEIYLPWAVEREQITATYEDGFLRIELPRLKQQTHTIRIIDIQSDDDSI